VATGSELLVDLRANALGRPVPARGWGRLSQAPRPPPRAPAEGWCGAAGQPGLCGASHKAAAVSCQQIQANKSESSTVG